jgi:hypothetical protein
MEQMEASAMESLTGRETIKRVKHGVENSDYASTQKLIELIRDLSRGIDETGIDQLGDLISGEVGFTARVIKAAQPMRYNPEGVHVEDITQAIQLVGLDRVRNVSMSLLLGEDNRSGQERDISGEANTIALASAIFARIAAEKSSYTDPNLCFVSGLLQNYGMILTSKFLPDHFLQFRKIEPRHGTEEAHQEVFGITQLDLSREILKWQKIPPSILRSLRVPSRSDLRNSSPTLEMQPMLAGHFGKEAGQVLANPRLTRARFDSLMGAILGKFSKSVPMDFDDLRQALEETRESFQEFKVLGGANGFSEPVLTRITMFTNDGEEEPPMTAVAKILEKEFGLEMPSAPMVIPPVEGTEPEEEKSKVLYAQGLRSISALAHSQSSSVEDVGAKGLETALELHRADSAFLFLLDESAGSFNFVSGVGKSVPDFKSVTDLPYNGKNVYSVCVDNSQNIFLEKPSGSSLTQSFPEWLQKLSHMEPFIFVPLYFTRSKLGFMLFIGGGSYTYNEYKASSSNTVRFAQVLAHLILKKLEDRKAVA